MNCDKYCDAIATKHRRDSGAECIATTRLIGGVVVAILVAMCRLSQYVVAIGRTA